MIQPDGRDHQQPLYPRVLPRLETRAIAKPIEQGKNVGDKEKRESLSQQGCETDQDGREAGKANTTDGHSQICF